MSQGFRQGHTTSRGNANGMAKLTAKDVRDIRRLRSGIGRRSLRNDPRSLKSIAEKYGISVTAVSHICMRRRWAHVP